MQKNELPKLRNCPFCGCEDVSGTQHRSPDNYEVICMGCFARVKRTAKRKAVEAWNRRVNNG